MIPRSKPIARSAPPKRGGHIKRKPRPASETLRIYGPKERVEFVKSLPCCACGVEGFSENAHVGNEGAGTGCKANADQIAPLCGSRFGIRGCHQILDDVLGREDFERTRKIDLDACAAETERLWQEHCERVKGLPF